VFFEPILQNTSLGKTEKKSIHEANGKVGEIKQNDQGAEVKQTERSQEIKDQNEMNDSTIKNAANPIPERNTAEKECKDVSDPSPSSPIDPENSNELEDEDAIDTTTEITQDPQSPKYEKPPEWPPYLHPANKKEILTTMRSSQKQMFILQCPINATETWITQIVNAAAYETKMDVLALHSLDLSNALTAWFVKTKNINSQHRPSPFENQQILHHTEQHSLQSHPKTDQDRTEEDETNATQEGDEDNQAEAQQQQPRGFVTIHAPASANFDAKRLMEFMMQGGAPVTPNNPAAPPKPDPFLIRTKHILRSAIANFSAQSKNPKVFLLNLGNVPANIQNDLYRTAYRHLDGIVIGVSIPPLPAVKAGEDQFSYTAPVEATGEEEAPEEPNSPKAIFMMGGNTAPSTPKGAFIAHPNLTTIHLIPSREPGFADMIAKQRNTLVSSRNVRRLNKIIAAQQMPLPHLDNILEHAELGYPALTRIVELAKGISNPVTSTSIEESIKILSEAEAARRKYILKDKKVPLVGLTKHEKKLVSSIVAPGKSALLSLLAYLTINVHRYYDRWL